LVSGIDITVTTLALAGVRRPAWMEGRDFFAPDHEPRDHVVSARDRCDYTIDRVRAVTTQRYQYLRNFLTDRPFMQPQYRDGRDYVEVPRELYQAGKLNAVQSFMWSPTRVPEELYDLDKDTHETRRITMPNQRQFVAQTAAVLLACGLIASLPPGFIAALEPSTREVLGKDGEWVREEPWEWQWNDGVLRLRTEPGGIWGGTELAKNGSCRNPQDAR
jgi:hypothetical protein